VRLLLVPLVAIAALLLGCDADVDQDDDVEPVPDAVRTGLAALYAGDDPTPDVTAESECFADGLLERRTLDELVDAGLVDDDGTVPPVAPILDVDTAEAWVDAADACTPYAEVSARALTAQSKGRLDGETYLACFTAEIAPERVREALVATLTGAFSSSPAVQDLSTAQATCARQSAPAE
jgi:hypothetical protein